MFTADNEVRVFYYGEGLSGFPASDALKLLSEEEAARYDRFKFAEDKLRFLIGRYILRTTASAFDTNANPGQVRIEISPTGMPYFRDLQLHFSITHSGNLVAVAFSRSARPGIDIELKRHLSDMKELSRRFYSEPEVLYLEKLEESKYHEEFFSIWAAKEAYIKSLGLGISKSLSSFSVIDNGLSDRVIELEGLTNTHSLISLDFGNNYASSLCLPVQMLQGSDLIIEKLSV